LNVVGVSDAPILVSGEGKVLPAQGTSAAVRFELRPADFTVSSASRQLTANYRDVATIVVDQGRVLLDIGGTKLLAERLGDRLGTLVGTLRERRARQLLTDRLIDLPTADGIPLVEYESDGEHGVAQLAYYPWGVALIPVDERRPWRLVRRADIAAATADKGRGRVRVELTRRPSATDVRPIELLGLGLDAEREGARMARLRQGAFDDATAIIAQLVPNATSGDRDRTAALLVDGRPATADEIGGAWTALEPAVLAEPTYAATYAALRDRSRGGGTWISLAPTKPNDPTAHMAWFFVSLPKDLVAFEMVSEGSHATYLFRANGDPAATVYDVSESLIDTRFLREPIYMTDQDLAAPDNQRYRFAIAALPSLRAARGRFVRRLIHADDESWATALDESIKEPTQQQES
jgi:hypothetical protein